MRILVIIHDFSLGGVERIAVRLASEWARRGHEVTMLCGVTDGPLLNHLARGIRLVAAEPSVRRGPGSRLILGRAAVGLVRKHRPDIIFLPGNYYFEAAIALKLALGRASPPIVGKISNTLHRQDKGRLGRAAYRTWFRIKARFVDAIVTMSERLRGEAQALVAGPPSRFTTIDEPILDDRPAPKPPTAANRGPRLVAAGRLAPQKNVDLLLHAFARLPAALGATLDIYGEGPLHSDLEKQIDRLGLQGSVRLCAYVSSLRDILPRYDLFLLSSDYEGFPAVIVEAFAAGLPVVTTDCSVGIHDVVTSAALGRIVPVGDTAAFASAVASVLEGPRPDRDAICAHVERFRLDRSAATYIAVFERLTQARCD